MSEPILLDSDALDSLVGHSVVSWGNDRDGTGTHFVLDDGRVLIFVGMLCILQSDDHVVH